MTSTGVLKFVSKSVTPLHLDLFDVACEHTMPSRAGMPGFLQGRKKVTREDMEVFIKMVRVEFHNTIRGEVRSKDPQYKKEPHPFDIFLLKPAMGRTRTVLAVCLPPRDDGPNTWMDEDEKFWPIRGDDNQTQHGRFLGSLSGPSRIITALSKALLKDLPEEQRALVQGAMERSKLVRVDDTPRAIIQSVKSPCPINESQRKAIGALLNPSFKDGFLVIQGPPGCGKTSTLVSMIHNVEKCVIVCAPSNAAVANIALKLIETNGFDVHNVTVYGFNCDESVHFLSPFHRGKYFQDYRAKTGSTKDDSTKDKMKRAFCDWLRLDPTKETSNTTLRKLCPQHSMSQSGRKEVNMGHARQLFAKSKVVFCTLNSSGSKTLRKFLPRKMFNTLLLDEAGQCTEAEFYIATTFPGVKRLVVLGDPKQLPATVVDQGCKKVGFAESWLSRVYTKHPDMVHLLDTQYRMDPEILKFPNQEFYNNRIKCGVNVQDRSPLVQQPFRFIDMKGRGEEKKSNKSWKNEIEAFVIHNILDSEDDDIANLRQLVGKKLRILVITPYRAQVKLLKKLVNSSSQGGQYTVEIATVDSFQGQEADVVVVSTVRTRSPGFVDDENRLNVALTRAKSLLRVVGEASFFRRLRRSSTLRRLVHYAEKEDSLHQKLCTS